jgi:hypothetical protein
LLQLQRWLLCNAGAAHCDVQILQLESALATMKAEHAGDDSQMAQQQQRIRQLDQHQQQLTQQLAAARCQAEEAQEKAQQCLQVAAAAVVHDTPGSSTSRGMYGQATTAATAACSGDSTSQAGQALGKAAVMPGIGVDERLSCGVGLLRDLPVAAQQEIAAQRRVAAVAKRDKVRRAVQVADVAGCNPAELSYYAWAKQSNIAGQHLPKPQHLLNLPGSCLITCFCSIHILLSRPGC